MNNEPDYEAIGWSVLADVFLGFCAVLGFIIVLPFLPFFFGAKWLARCLGKHYVARHKIPNPDDGIQAPGG